MNSNILTLEKLTCPSCMKKIEDAVNGLAGVERIKILFDKNKAKVIYDDSLTIDDIVSTIHEVGYQVQTVK